LDGIKLKIHKGIIYDRCYRLLKMISRPFKHLFNFSLLSYIGLNSDGSGLPEFVDKCLGFVFTLKIVDDDVGSFSVKGVGNFTTDSTTCAPYSNDFFGAFHVRYPPMSIKKTTIKVIERKQHLSVLRSLSFASPS